MEGIQPSDAGFLVKLLIFAAIGALVAARRPHNPIGWLLCGVPVAFGLSFLGDPVYARAVLEGHDPTLAQRLFLWVSTGCGCSASCPRSPWLRCGCGLRRARAKVSRP